MKNYSKEGQKLPLFGVGPILIFVIAIVNAIAIIVSSYVINIGILEGAWILVFRIVGGIIIVLGIVDWLILTLVLKNTEEKWLFEVYGEEYMIYKNRVNRCIPWFPKKPIDI
ncbi:MAG: hypothetical protein IKW81_11295 [Pseudobutyrivibrio sp.]|nr:hypothetical protein [Pseudobutyrivibrio sp.]